MKKLLFLVLSPLSLMSGSLIKKQVKTPIPDHLVHTRTIIHTDTSTSALQPVNTKRLYQHNKRKDIVTYAMSMIGRPYVYAGITPKGFDCSGFITYVYKTYGLSLPHSSAMQAKEGQSVKRQEAKPGDIVIFTGTNSSIRKPGHVGIVISSPGDTISFVHASSNGGVKVSKVKGTGYEKRFMEVRGVL
ncbi:C40 family peptidase [Pontibacter silvestris]|uniref:C40 family peptidase n=1 Tax=Pontibacter silvestris TaxID=2305183 RepID=A0ABW4X0C3_9BACT|nr:C40 family peptidase [Pontibacter silvestris]MCC9136004.1 C40 family peptidase [Pontibacter silvestris]